MPPMPQSPAPAPHRAIEAVWRIESAKVIASVARIVRDVGLAEELAQDALVAALEHWGERGVPDNPGAWLMTTAKNRAFDRLRQDALHARKHDELGADLEAMQLHVEPDFVDALGAARDDDIGDDLLRLIFTACHPVLAEPARVALTLRLLGGLTTQEIARAYLTPEATIAQRIVRAKRTLAEAQVPFEVPHGEALAPRLASVLAVVYLIFNEGYSATAGDDWMRPALCDEALRLGRTLATLVGRWGSERTAPGPARPARPAPGGAARRSPRRAGADAASPARLDADPHGGRSPQGGGLGALTSEVLGLVALMELQASRVPARTDAQGQPVLLPAQDRSRWDALLIRRGLAALERADALADAAGAARGPYALQAALAACHARAHHTDATDWAQIVALYDALAEVAPSPVVALNRAVAVGMAFGPAAGLALVDALAGEPLLARYHWLPSVRADLLAKLGRGAEARAEFERAAAMALNGRERELLFARARGFEPA